MPNQQPLLHTFCLGREHSSCSVGPRWGLLTVDAARLPPLFRREHLGQTHFKMFLGQVDPISTTAPSCTDSPPRLSLSTQPNHRRKKRRYECHFSSFFSQAQSIALPSSPSSTLCFWTINESSCPAASLFTPALATRAPMKVT